jgi:TonB family protein
MHIKIRKPVLLFFIGLALLSVVADPRTMLTKALESFPASQAPADWHAYRLIDDEFSVSLPTLPAMSSYRLNPEPGSESRVRHIIGAYGEGVAYVVYVFERKQSLDDFISNFRHFSEGNFVRDMDVGGMRGKAYGFKNDQRIGSTYFLATKSRIYVFEAQGSLLGKPDAGISKFLESIKFGKNPDGEILVDGPGLQLSSDSVTSATIGAGQQGNNGVIELRADQPMSSKLVSLKPVVVAKPEPTYTEDARRHQITGTIVIRCVFAASGAVTNIVAMSKLPDGLTEKAIAAAQQIRFIPAIKDGRFVSMYMQLEYNFNLY